MAQAHNHLQSYTKKSDCAGIFGLFLNFVSLFFTTFASDSWRRQVTVAANGRINETEFHMNDKPLIFVSNDDGYTSGGITALIDMLCPLANLLVVAPDAPRSGFSCAFSSTSPLRLTPQFREDGLEIWSCNGTPVDCLKLALDQFCADRQPDMVVSGINHGDNASVNTHYSGTMGVAMEGAMKYIPSVAFSLCDQHPDADFSPMRGIVDSVTRRVLRDGLPKGVCLNVNVPLVEHLKGVKVCRMAYGTWGNECVKMHHPRGYDYFWMTGSYTNDEPLAEDTDNWALTHGYIAITPTHIDVTDYAMLASMKDWGLAY